MNFNHCFKIFDSISNLKSLEMAITGDKSNVYW